MLMNPPGDALPLRISSRLVDLLVRRHTDRAPAGSSLRRHSRCQRGRLHRSRTNCSALSSCTVRLPHKARSCPQACSAPSGNVPAHGTAHRGHPRGDTRCRRGTLSHRRRAGSAHKASPPDIARLWDGSWSLAPLKAHSTAEVTLQLIAIKPGILKLSGLRLLEKATGQTHEFGSLAEIFAHELFEPAY